MLADNKIDSLDTHLEQFKLNNQTSQNDLQNLLKEYGALLLDYKSLKKAFEEKGTRSVAKVTSIASPAAPRAAAAAEKPRNPYILVLVDGNGYVFNDELIREKEEGGMRAARMLSDAVEKYLHQSIPEARSARVVVRIYADLTNLSKQLAKSKVTGLEKRSIAPFSAAFTRGISLFDFVDALDEKGTKFKIREQFNIAVEDSACTHILYAACHDSAYLSLLSPFSGHRDKITLVQGAAWNPDFHQFNLNVTQFPTIFRWSELPTAPPNVKTTYMNGTTAPKPKVALKQVAVSPLTGPPTGSRPFDSWPGKMSWRSSTRETDDASSTATHGFHAGIELNHGEHSAPSKRDSQQACKYFQKGYCRFGNQCNFMHVRPAVTNTNRSDISSHLPSTLAPGFIALNKDSQRLDTYISPPNPEEWAIYNERFHKQKPCNNYHIHRECITFGCPFDHRDLEPESRHVLEYVLKCSPCPKKSECRDAKCAYGHLCQKDGCQGQMKGCRMKADLHTVDPEVARTVSVEEDEELVHGEGVVMQQEIHNLW